MVRSRDNCRDKFVIAFLAQTGQRIAVLTVMNHEVITRKGHTYGIVRVDSTLRNAKGENVNASGRKYRFVIGRNTMWLLDRLPRYEGGWSLDITQRQIGRIVDEAAKSIGLQDKKPTEIGRSWSRIHPNTFRKYWKARMRAAKADGNLMTYMMGYNIPRWAQPWEEPDDELLKAYKRAERYLTVLGTPPDGRV